MKLSDRAASIVLLLGIGYGSFALAYPEWLVDTEGRSWRLPDTPTGVRVMAVVCLVGFGSGTAMRVRSGHFRLRPTGDPGEHVSG